MRKQEDNLPLIENSNVGIGVRAGRDRRDDVHPDADGNVHPGQGGMSAFDDPEIMPDWLLPVSLGGINKKNLTIFSIQIEQLGENLAPRPEGDGHWLIEPAQITALAEYIGNLTATRNNWAIYAE